MSALAAFMITPLLVWIGLFLYLLYIDKQIKELKK
ncbi:MAG TPA: CcmD family protein [Armatimonadota bacterium]|nr:CcmD family protein [Armatimonadota bacterium]HPP74412.1 CcmD family protein [Armatimonadota bacterium]